MREKGGGGEKKNERKRHVVRWRQREREKQLDERRARGPGGRRGGGSRGSTFLIQGEAIKMTEPLLARADLYPFTTQRVPDKK